MNKKLLATAIGATLAAGMGLANADVKLYGQIDLSYNKTDSDASGYDDDTTMKSKNSAIGFKGSEDLGNGMSAFFKIEYETDVANAGSNGDGWTGRDQYVGLAWENFGKLTFGTTSTAYKSPSKKIDDWYRTTLQSRDIGLQSNLHGGKGEEGQGRSTNVARYDSPSWNGLSLNATYTLDSNKQGGQEDDNPYSVGVQWKWNNLYTAASYINTNNGNYDDTAAAQFVAGYTLNDFEIHGIYELDKGLITGQRTNGINESLGGRAGGADDDGANVWSAGATYTIGNNVIGADYGKGSDSDGKDGISNTADDVQEYTTWRVAAWHKFSNRTGIYAGYWNQDFDKKGEDNNFALGLRHKF